MTDQQGYERAPQGGAPPHAVRLQAEEDSDTEQGVPCDGPIGHPRRRGHQARGRTHHRSPGRDAEADAEGAGSLPQSVSCV